VGLCCWGGWGGGRVSGWCVLWLFVVLLLWGFSFFFFCSAGQSTDLSLAYHISPKYLIAFYAASPFVLSFAVRQIVTSSPFVCATIIGFPKPAPGQLPPSKPGSFLVRSGRLRPGLHVIDAPLPVKRARPANLPLMLATRRQAGSSGKITARSRYFVSPARFALSAVLSAPAKFLGG